MNDPFDGPFGLTQIDIKPFAVPGFDLEVRSHVSMLHDDLQFIRVMQADSDVATAYIPRASPHLEEAKQFLIDITRLRCGA